MHLDPRLFHFVGGARGSLRVLSTTAVVGASLPPCDRVHIGFGHADAAIAHTAAWLLHGMRSNERYTDRHEHERLQATQAALGRPEATRGAILPIRKNAAWWALPQDERLAIFTTRSRHTEIGQRYLPAIARRLYHCRDLAEDAPFDFVTLFDFAPEHEPAFDDMLAALRETEEWRYVEREVDVRFERVV
jgi:hypothetical protein